MGLSNVIRNGSVVILSSKLKSKWLINASLSISDMRADFRVDAKLINRIFVKGWRLEAIIKRCLLDVVLILDAKSKMLEISSLTVQSIEGFQLKTEKLSWPFNEVVSQILDREQERFKLIISENAERYMQEALKVINVSQIINKMRNN